jgi:endonuclease YncB( thermonuclease family)
MYRSINSNKTKLKQVYYLADGKTWEYINQNNKPWQYTLFEIESVGKLLNDDVNDLRL